MQLPRITLSFGAGDTTKTANIVVSGEKKIFDVVLRIPDWTAAITTTFSILNANGLAIYSIAALADPQLTLPVIYN